MNDEFVNDYKFVDVEICGPMRPWWSHRKSVRMDEPDAPARRWKVMRDWVAKQIKEQA